ncbi:hypothetical protein [Methanobrevibacter sp.]|uniref:hypothetical protein n=1 Tax=Methanobrevibacter sp. TaxID=66852 RepID=UPI003863B13A
MEILSDVDIKSVVFGAAIAATCFIIGMNGMDLAYPFASIGLLYTGYKAKNLKWGAGLGAFASTPLMVLSLDQRFVGVLDGKTEIIIILLIFFVGALVGFVGAWAKRDRVKAKEEYEKKQKIGKNKNKKKKTQETPKENKGFLNKILKKE